jgi:hypothetical protein
VSAASQNGDQGEPEDGLKLWGYMPGHVHYKVGAVAEVSQVATLAIEFNLRHRTVHGRILR